MVSPPILEEDMDYDERKREANSKTMLLPSKVLPKTLGTMTPAATLENTVQLKHVRFQSVTPLRQTKNRLESD